MPIDPRHRPLWERITAHRLDDPSAPLTFTARLARENGWTIGYALRVVREYRRFIFLARTSRDPVTPSEDVDQAWHLHLVFTRDYWEVFCGDTLGGPLHHGPTRGGASESDRFGAQYRGTLAAYAAVFDEAPPADIWPTVEQRFGPDLHWRRVSLARHWVIAKPDWLRPRPRPRAGLAMLAGLPLVAVGVPNPLDLSAGPFLGLFATLAIAALVAGIILRQALRPGGDAMVTVSDVEPLELALLADDGRLRYATTGLVMLGADSPVPAAPPADASPLLSSLHARLAALGAAPVLDALKAAVEMAREDVEPRLVARGLLVGSWWTTTAPWILLAPAAATLTLGLAKIVVGVSRGKPVGFLVMGCVALALVSLLAVARKPRRTRQGDAVLRDARSRFRESGQAATGNGTERNDACLPLAVALLGTAVLADSSHASLHGAVKTLGPSAAGGGCGSSGGDSGGDSGGGCGGCGGCGGGGGD